MNIEIGEYVRTKYGITQFKAYRTINGNKLLCMPVKDGSNGIFANIEDIIKLSPNIIDLIEVGDYVNGHKVRAVYLKGTTHYIKLDFENEKGKRFYNEDVKSIVTKEQFSNMEYRV